MAEHDGRGEAQPLHAGPDQRGLPVGRRIRPTLRTIAPAEARTVEGNDLEAARGKTRPEWFHDIRRIAARPVQEQHDATFASRGAHPGEVQPPARHLDEFAARREARFKRMGLPAGEQETRAEQNARD